MSRPLALTRIRLVARHVFKESVRDRVLYAIGVFALLLVGASILIGQITAGEDVKIIKDLGLSTIEVAGVLMSVFIGVGLVAREIERRSVFALLAKPLPRWEFVVGKYCGLLLTLGVNIAAMTVALYVMMAYLNWDAVPKARAAWDAPAMDPRLLLAVGMILAELALLTAVALFFSAFSSSALLSVAFTLGVYVTGLLSADLRHFGDFVDVSPVVARAVSLVGWVVPAFSAFDVKAQVVHGLPIGAGFVWTTILYALVYAAALVVGTATVFSRREFK
jgi:ABC-type transport system involved in multi-copper enzyme maturation permease subunit